MGSAVVEKFAERDREHTATKNKHKHMYDAVANVSSTLCGVWSEIDAYNSLACAFGVFYDNVNLQ